MWPKYCTIGSYDWTNSVFVKHILLHISGSWPIGVRLKSHHKAFKSRTKAGVNPWFAKSSCKNVEPRATCALFLCLRCAAHSLCHQPDVPYSSVVLSCVAAECKTGEMPAGSGAHECGSRRCGAAWSHGCCRYTGCWSDVQWLCIDR